MTTGRSISTLAMVILAAAMCGPASSDTVVVDPVIDGPISRPTLSSISRAVGSTAGGTEITIEGTDFTSGATVTFGGIAARSVVIESQTTMKVQSPANAVGTVDVVLTNRDGGSALIQNAFEYLPAATTTYIAHDFEDGTVGAFTKFANNGANISVGNWGSGYAVSGTQSVRAQAVGGVPAGGSRLVHFYSPGQPALAPNGVYQRWYIRVDQSTIQAVRSGQIKLLLNRADTNPPSWLHMGFGGQFPGPQDHVSVLKDYNTGALPNGATRTGYKIVADRWIEFQTWFKRSGGAGRARLWIDGREVLDVTDPRFGGDDPNKIMRWFIGIAYTQATAPGGTLTIYIDDPVAADGFIESVRQ